jgi:hypothetical protein
MGKEDAVYKRRKKKARRDIIITSLYIVSPPKEIFDYISGALSFCCGVCWRSSSNKKGIFFNQ